MQISLSFSECGKWVVLLLLFQSFFCQCYSPEKLAGKSRYGSFLVFGKGGGFSGKGFEYRISEKGNLEKKINDAFVKYGKVPENITSQIFNNYFWLKLDRINANNPGNIYYFVQLDAYDKNTNRITWGKEPMEYPDLTAYFSMLTDVVKKYGNHAANQ